MPQLKILVTGGAGFIGSAVVRHLLAQPDLCVLNVDSLTYAGNLASLADVASHERYRFEQVDICDVRAVRALFSSYQPNIVLNLAAETHVDRSIDAPSAFINTNVVGTGVLLDAARDLWLGASEADRSAFRFVHVSTDEVFGDLGPADPPFDENTAYAPSSPYSASKASSDHLVRAWNRTYGLPTLITNCSNNYGPRQFPEKLIPMMILNALEHQPLPVYGDGGNVRDWLYVEDHARALFQVATKGRVGETYCIGGGAEVRNIDIVRTLCGELERRRPDRVPAQDGGFESLIRFVPDRPGHDRRYAVDWSKINREIGWSPKESLASGLAKTVGWYVDNSWWCEEVQTAYKRQRLGLAAEAST